ncbi:binding-protein-dependent transport systems inner membrane component [Beutenbergia cavernae DSM 12333]|uniref:Binding-protein-dependent transport systems inner membrane component n=1 Tax=Beutenbergia cavernae (strain ATCC BAA-8 / DSM 12333 / CCUG 43141 / JCM 11478 / NBRC 16432 / NCIMB 13614 / HKI 0122) TaxID=471853 RepID=C5C1W2_BEUC1|nr:carbohydrate ABC transporter permease [Beutenbergia cavernae]ACQ79580.1 binding-protein-dependent transport systems inner membrane component [Beutenbergia cavernae DSM 12333]
MSIRIDPELVPAPDDGVRRKSGRRRHPLRPAWDEEPSRAGVTVKATVLVVVVLTVVFPLYTILLTSLSTRDSTIRAGGMMVWPDELTWGAYSTILGGGIVTRAMLVSIGVTAVGTLISTAVSVLAAYGLSRTGSLLHRPILFVFLITMFFGAGLIPTYLLVSTLGLIDSYWALILPGAVSAFNILILRNFFQGIDAGILDAARIDGAGDWRILWTIVLPMSKAATAVIALFYGVGYWNAFFNAMLYINDNTKWPLQLVLRSYVLQGASLPGSQDMGDVASGATTGLPVQMAVVVLAVLPIVLVYPFVQKHFTKGVIAGAIKG